ncbi:MAG: ParA family protein [Fimbriimonadaceae bacterium]|nr:ParA family protein [Fimbriimonadaceae bacterium]
MAVWGVVNQKGGVGKTTTAVNLATGLARAGRRVLLIDSDPQGNATTGLGADKSAVPGTLFDVYRSLAENMDAAGLIEQFILPGAEGRPDLLPATLDLAGAEGVLQAAVGKEVLLRDALEPILDRYDTILIDAPPSLGLITVNILAACDEVIVPMQGEFYALEGLSQLVRTIEIVRKRINPRLKIGRVVLTMFDGRSRLAQQVSQELSEFFGEKLSQTVIPRNVRLGEAPGHGIPAIELFPESKGAQAYSALVEEVLAG